MGYAALPQFTNLGLPTRRLSQVSLPSQDWGAEVRVNPR